jgi:hypothetical protein
MKSWWFSSNGWKSICEKRKPLLMLLMKLNFTFRYITNKNKAEKWYFLGPYKIYYESVTSFLTIDVNVLASELLMPGRDFEVQEDACGGDMGRCTKHNDVQLSKNMLNHCLKCINFVICYIMKRIMYHSIFKIVLKWISWL